LPKYCPNKLPPKVSSLLNQTLWALECLQGFCKIWTSWPRFWPHMTQCQTLPRSLWALECLQGFCKIWTSWPRFWPHMTQCQTLPRYHQEKLWPLVCLQSFCTIKPYDLDFVPTLPNVKLGLDIVQTNILVKFHHYWTKTLVYGVLTRFLLDLTLWRIFWPLMTKHQILLTQCLQGFSFFFDLVT